MAKTTDDLILQYANLLHEHGDPEARAVREFLSQHQEDTTLQARAQVMRELYMLYKQS